MYRVKPCWRQVPAGRGAVKAIRRRMATEAAAPVTPKKKPRIVRRILLSTALLTGTFYVGSTFVAFNNQKYYDFFSDHVPLGESMLEYAESNKWDTMTFRSAIESTKETAVSAQRTIMDKVNGTSKAVEEKKQEAKEKAKEAKQAAKSTLDKSKEQLSSVAKTLKTEVQKTTQTVTAATSSAAAAAKHQSDQFVEEIQNLVREAEDAIKGTYPAHVKSEAEAAAASTSKTVAKALDTPKDTPKAGVYDAPLPVGFEPPPGYARPRAPAPAPASTTATPLVAPAVALLTSSEPVINQLAATIDQLTSYLAANPASAPKVQPLLDSAKQELSALSERFEQVRDDAKVGLEKQIGEQAKEYNIKMLELEMLAQEKIDSQEEEFRKFFIEERNRIVDAYRAKLQQELETQSELINERLKNEVVAQGIELQRRWIRDIKIMVEQERGGRLSKLDELSTHLKRVERIALDNSVYLDENIRIHALWTAIRSVSSRLNSTERTPFREELRVLRHLGLAREDPVIKETLESIEKSDVPDVGVEPLADLTTWFTTSVVPRISQVALLPDDAPSGVIAHLASNFLSSFRFQRHGLVEGDDALSVLARAEWHLNEKNLDAAAREVNQLKGSAKALAKDWLDAARRRLEVEQALEIVQTQATLSSLLVV